MQALKFYTDVHIAKAVAVQLRDRGIDVVRCQDIAMASAEDVEHLEYATAHGRVVITNDDDFTQLDAKWREIGRKHSGIMYCLPHVQGTAALGKIVSICIEYYELIAGDAGTLEEDIENQIIYVS